MRNGGKRTAKGKTTSQTLVAVEAEKRAKEEKKGDSGFAKSCKEKKTHKIEISGF